LEQVSGHVAYQGRGILQQSMTNDYKFYAYDQTLPEKINCNLISGILPQERVCKNIREAYDYPDALFIIDSNFFSNDFPNNILEYRLDKNYVTKVLVDISYETGISEQDYNKKIASLAKHGVDAKDIITILNRSGYHKWCDKFINQICFIDLFAVSAVVRHLVFDLPICDLPLTKRTNRANLVMGKINKPSRKKIIKSFYNSKLRENTLFGFLGQIDTDQLELKNFVKNNQGPIDGVDIIDQQDGVSSQGWSKSTKIYTESTVSVVCETHETNDSLFLTEKTYRPIINKSPFVIRAAFPALEYLKAIGFKTFGNIIDESYDNNTDVSDDNSKQLVDAAEQLLLALPNNYDELQKIVDDNYKLLIMFAQSELALLNKRLFSLLS